MNWLYRLAQFLRGVPEDDASRARREQRARALIEHLAQRIVARRLEVPALLFLEMHRPFTFLVSQSLLLGTPLLGLFASPVEIEEYAQLADSRENLDLLLRRIEELASLRECAQTPDALGDGG